MMKGYAFVSSVNHLYGVIIKLIHFIAVGKYLATSVGEVIDDGALLTKKNHDAWIFGCWSNMIKCVSRFQMKTFFFSSQITLSLHISLLYNISSSKKNIYSSFSSSCDVCIKILAIRSQSASFMFLGVFILREKSAFLIWFCCSRTYGVLLCTICCALKFLAIMKLNEIWSEGTSVCAYF